MKFIKMIDVARTVETVLARHESPNNPEVQSKVLLCRTVLTVLGFGGTHFAVTKNGTTIAVTGQLDKAVAIYNILS